MIEYVHVQLSIWGKAQMADARKGLGYSPVCPMFKDTRHGGVYRSAPPLGVSITERSNVDDTDRAVQRLDRVQRQLVVEYYVVGGTGEQIARRLGIGRQRLYERLTVLHATMLGLLNDVIADVLPDAVDTIRTGSV